MAMEKTRDLVVAEVTVERPVIDRILVFGVVGAK